ncbi:alpha-hydroxy-acid oxidizing protein [Desmospora profundinema]|uniref:L-lactate oxidase n=1 Tax=Desmospora profundinema TaxID=1571184 RepID=A0ABU1IIL0_9BACL|nr:alpha-hydroxy-acid oxidizing protein [Desmospora profundinema]MDR6224377.1 L-lactate dehydrogenase (cytochrome) [Desmospora profundinema]
MRDFGTEVREDIYREMLLPPRFRLPISYEGWKKRARMTLDPLAFDFLEYGAGAGDTVRANREAFYRWRILPRLLVDVSHRDLSVSLFGHTYPFPVFLAPVSRQRLFHPEAELASARAAAKLGVPFILSTLSTCSIEEVAAVMGGAPRWFQLYWGKDPDVTASFIRRAQAAGYSAIVVTLDIPADGWRERDLQNDFIPLRFGWGVGNFLTDPAFLRKLALPPQIDPQAAVQKAYQIWNNPGLTWDDLDFLRKQTRLPLMIKGLLHPKDAALALKKGIDGIIVSNHGGRYLDGAVAALDRLPGVCEVVKGRIPVLMDSGIRGGSDVIKAISLGAAAVLVGKLYAFGLAAAGERGVYQTVRNIIADTDITMGNAGQTSISNLDRFLLRSGNDVDD